MKSYTVQKVMHKDQHITMYLSNIPLRIGTDNFAGLTSLVDSFEPSLALFFVFFPHLF